MSATISFRAAFAGNKRFWAAVEDSQQVTANPGWTTLGYWTWIVPQAPELSITKTHTPTFFILGQTGAYTLKVTNTGNAPTNATVTATDTLPAGLTATSMSGSGWSCNLSALSCTRSDTLTPGNSYNTIALAVSVANNAPGSVTNLAGVTGGGVTATVPTAKASDQTTIVNTTTCSSGSQTFANSGSTTWTVPANCTQVTLEAWGAGGGGGNGDANSGGGGGGGCGAYANNSIGVSPGQTYSITVGSGGAPSCYGGACAGGDSYIQISGYDQVRAAGGQGAQNGSDVANGGSGGAGGSAGSSTGTNRYSGGAGGAGWSGSPASAGSGGGEGENGSYGGTGSDATNAYYSGPGSGNGAQGEGYYNGCTSGMGDCNGRQPGGGAGGAMGGWGGATRAGGTGGNGQVKITWSGTVAPVWTIIETDSGNFAQGLQGAKYTVQVGNIGAGNSPSGANVNVTVTLPSNPASLTATSLSGAGWNCSGLTCTRTDALAAGAAYPPITVTVNVANNAPATVTTTAAVTVNGGSPVTASDTTHIPQGAAPPTFNPPAGAYHTALNVTLQAASGASIRYATSPDGTTWGPWLPYKSPIPVTGAITIQAIASVTGMADSAPAVAAYTLQFLLTTTVNPPGEGSVTVSPSGPYAPGTAVTITAAANPGYAFMNFSGDLSGSAISQTLTMNGPKSAFANFVSTSSSVIPRAPTSGPGTAYAASLGQPLTLSFTFTDPYGAEDLFNAQAYIAPSLADNSSSNPVCNIGYFNFTDRANPNPDLSKGSYPAGLYLTTSSGLSGVLWDAATIPLMPPETPTTITNSFCTLSNFHYSKSGGTVSFSVDVAFNAPLSPTGSSTPDTIWTFAAGSACSAKPTPSGCNPNGVLGDGAWDQAGTVSMVPDFDFTIDTPSVSFLAGTSKTFNVTVRPRNGLNPSSVVLASTGGPPNATITVGAGIINSDGSVTTPIAVATKATDALGQPGQAGLSFLTITGSSSGVAHFATAKLLLQDFSAQYTYPYPGPTCSGGHFTYGVTINGTNGYTPPADSTITFYKFTKGDQITSAGLGAVSVVGSGPTIQATISINASSSCYEQYYYVEFAVASGGVSHYSWMLIDFNPPTGSQGISLSVGPSTQTLSTAGTVGYSIVVNSVNNFGGAVDVSVSTSGWPAGLHVSSATPIHFNNVVSLSPGTATLAVTSDGSPPQGLYSFTATAQPTAGGTAQTATASVTVGASTAQGYTVTTNPPGLSVVVDGQQCGAAPCPAYNWLAGTTHSITTPTRQSPASGTRYEFLSWSDNGSVAHSITAGSSPTSYTANFTVVNLYYDSQLVALDSGDVFGWFDAWSDSPELAAWVSGATLQQNGSTIYGPTDGNTGSTASTVSLPGFSLSVQGFGDYTFLATPYWYDCCGYWGGDQSSVLITYPQPSITSLSTNYGLPGTSVAVTISGTGLGIRDQDLNVYQGVTSVNVSGNGCPGSSCGVTASFEPVSVDPFAPFPVPPATSVNATLTIAAGAAAGTYQLSVTAFGFQTPNSLPFVVADATPQITSVSPATFSVGSGPVPVVIAGTGFGSNTALDPSQILIQPGSGLTLNALSSWSPTQINATVTPTAVGDYGISVVSGGAGGNGFQAGPQSQTAAQSNTFRVTAGTNPVTLALTRQSLTQVVAAGTPTGGNYSYSAVSFGGSTVQLSPNTTVTPQNVTITLQDPPNPSPNGSPSPGGLAEVDVIYVGPSGASGLKTFNVATFGLSCYFTASENDYWNGQNCSSSGGYSGAGPASGLQGQYCKAFLADVRLQGSGVTRQGSSIKYDTTARTYYQAPLVGADQSPVVAGQTVARDRNIIPIGGVYVSLDGLGDFLANDVGNKKYIVGYRIDVYEGVGRGVCAGFPLNIPIGACNPGNPQCPASTIQ